MLLPKPTPPGNLDRAAEKPIPTWYAIKLHKALLGGGVYNTLEELLCVADASTSESHYYHVDLWIPDQQVAIEVDGSHHQTDERQRSFDSFRDMIMEDNGIRVLRVTNHEIVEYVDEVLRLVDEFCACYLT